MILYNDDDDTEDEEEFENMVLFYEYSSFSALMKVSTSHSLRQSDFQLSFSVCEFRICAFRILQVSGAIVVSIARGS